MEHKVRVENRVVKTTIVRTIEELNQSLRDLLSTINNNKERDLKHIVGLDIEKSYQGTPSIIPSNISHQSLQKTQTSKESGMQTHNDSLQIPVTLKDLGLHTPVIPKGFSLRTHKNEGSIIDEQKKVLEKVAVVKLCFNTSCLIIQLMHMGKPPCSLAEFLQLQEVSFVGVGIQHCLDALSREYGIKCRNAVDLGHLAAVVNKSEIYRYFGLLDLANKVCVTSDVKKISGVEALGSWGATTLSKEQIEVGTWRAFLCYYLGNKLLGGYMPESDEGASYYNNYYYD